jgi:hypothetical protein
MTSKHHENFKIIPIILLLSFLDTTTIYDNLVMKLNQAVAILTCFQERFRFEYRPGHSLSWDFGRYTPVPPGKYQESALN